MASWGFVISFIIAASCGAGLRYLLSHEMVVVPWPVFVANLTGSFLMGFLYIYLDRVGMQAKVIVCVAFLGAFTTFSSFSLDMVRMLNQGAFKAATVYFFGTNILCILGCFGGLQIGKILVSRL